MYINVAGRQIEIPNRELKKPALQPGFAYNRLSWSSASAIAAAAVSTGKAAERDYFWALEECGMGGFLGEPKRQKRDHIQNAPSSSSHTFLDVNNDSTADGENSSGNYLTAAYFDAPSSGALSSPPPPTVVDTHKYAGDVACRPESRETIRSRLFSAYTYHQSSTGHMKVDENLIMNFSCDDEECMKQQMEATFDLRGYLHSEGLSAALTFYCASIKKGKPLLSFARALGLLVLWRMVLVTCSPRKPTIAVSLRLIQYIPHTWPNDPQAIFDMAYGLWDFHSHQSGVIRASSDQSHRVSCLLTFLLLCS